jgi:hypothetical protein
MDINQKTCQNQFNFKYLKDIPLIDKYLNILINWKTICSLIRFLSSKKKG